MCPRTISFERHPLTQTPAGFAKTEGGPWRWGTELMIELIISFRPCILSMPVSNPPPPPPSLSHTHLKGTSRESSEHFGKGLHELRLLPKRRDNCTYVVAFFYIHNI